MSKDAAPAVRTPIWKKIVVFLLVFGPLALIVRQIASGWSALAASHLRFSLPWLLLSFALLFINFLLVSQTWAIIFRAMHPERRVTMRQTFAIIYTAQLGRYIPGKVWILIGQALMAERMGYKKTDALTASVVQMICGNGGAAVVFGLSLLGMGKPLWLALLVMAAGAAILVALLFAPGVIEKPLNAWRVKRGKEPVRLAVPPSATVRCFLLMTLAWVEHCLAFAALVWSVSPPAALDFFEIAFAYNLAYHIGFYLLIVPGGLGVREGALTAALAPLLGTALAGVAALFQRVWYTIGEVLAFAAAVFLAWREGALPRGKRGLHELFSSFDPEALDGSLDPEALDGSR